MFEIFISLPIGISLFFTLTFFIRAKKQGKPFLFLGFFFFLFFMILIAMVLVSKNAETETSNAWVDLCSLLFYVALISIPQTFYFYVVAISKKIKQKKYKETFIKHYYLPILLLLINLFSFFYLKGSSNEESLIYEVATNVMNYANFLSLLFIFPVLNCYYIYKTIQVYRAHKKVVADVFSYKEGVDLRWI